MWPRFYQSGLSKLSQAAKSLKNPNLCCSRHHRPQVRHKTSMEPVTPIPTPCVLLSNDTEEVARFLQYSGIGDSGGEVVGNPILQFIPASKATQLPPVTPIRIPVVYKVVPPNDAGKYVPYKFDWTVYKDNLHTKDYGQVVIYGEVVTSTMDVANPFFRVPTDVSVTAIATQQTGGRAGHGKKWPSPEGEAMFTLRDCFPPDSPVAVHRHALESITAAAAVKAIRGVPGLARLDIGFVWPQNIYVGMQKIGGVLVEYADYDDQFLASIGCGIFVSAPSPSLNDIIKRLYPKQPLLSTEEVLGRTITCMEEMIAQYHEKGPKFLSEICHQYWVHTDGDVKFHISSEGQEKVADAIIEGIDEDGLLVISPKAETDFAGPKHLHPGMYKFDREKNMIIKKGVKFPGQAE